MEEFTIRMYVEAPNKAFSEIAESVLIAPSGEENKLNFTSVGRFLPFLNGVFVLNALPERRKSSESLWEIQHEVFFQHVGGGSDG